MFPNHPTLPDLQAYFKRVLAERGFADETVKDKLVLLTEELGELARAIRRSEGIAIAKDTKRSEVADEIADCVIYLVDLTNKLGIDLERAIRDKEEKNAKRSWGKESEK